MRGVYAAALAIALMACRDLDFLPADECGNGVLEPSAGEVCDGYATEAGTHCIAPNEDGACQFGCGSEHADAHCPEGWGCGIDGFCRRASGELEAPFDIGGPSGSMVVDDADGDGIDDITRLTSTQLSVDYFGADGFPSGQASLRVAKGTALSAAHLDADDFLDHVVAVLEGMVVVRGGPSRNLLPTLQLTPLPTLPRAVLAIDAHERPGDEIVFLEGTAITLRSAAETVQIAAPHDASAGAIIEGAQLDESSETEELVLGYWRHPELHVYGARGNPSGWATDLLTVVTVPEAPLDRLFVEDWNLDGHLDLLIVSFSGLAVAYGTGTGSFHSSLPLPAPGSEDNAASSFECSTSPMALANLDGIGVSDFVSETGVFFLEQPSDCVMTDSSVAEPPDGTFWRRAIPADFNGDGRNDLAVRTADGGEVTVLLGTPNGTFNPFNVATSGPVLHDGVGDFDGDLHDDLVLVESVGNKEVLTIAYGNASGGLDAPYPVGRVHDIHHLVSGYGLLQNTTWVDGISELLVIGELEVGKPGATVVLGRSDRFPIAPLALSLPGDLPAYASGQTTARLVLDSNAAIVAMLTNGMEMGIAALAPSAEAQLRVGTPAMMVGDAFNSAQLTPVDLDGDGVDHVFMMQSPLLGLDVTLLHTVGLDDGVPRLGSAASFTLSELSEPSGLGTPRSCVLRDAEPPSVVAMVTTVETRQLAVFRGADLAALVAGGSEPPIEPALLSVQDDPLAFVAAFACANMDADAAVEIVFVEVPASEADLRLYMIEPEPNGWTEPKLLATIPWSFSADPNSTPYYDPYGAHMGVGDLNGDGVDDIAFMSSDMMLVFLGKPLAP